MNFPEKFEKRNFRDRLAKIAEKNDYLVKRWITGNKKNNYYNKTDRSDKIEKGNLEYYALIDWILPSKNYTYREINMTEYCDVKSDINKKNGEKLVRSSIIPIVKKDGENYWMLGSFHDYENSGDPILSDFAGSCEKIDMKDNCPALHCALRELKEESKGLLNEIIQNAISADPKNIAIFEGIFQNEKIFFMFVSLNYNDIKDIPSLFLETDRMDHDKKNKLGLINFYRQNDIKKYLYRTAKNLTDFISYLNL
jgi:hypothetical protein